MITQLDTENADRNLTALITVLTDTPDASLNMRCQAWVALGDGAKNLDGTGGLFDLVITVGGQTTQPSPKRFNFGTEVRSGIKSDEFVVPANQEVVVRVKSPNGADTDVDTTAYLYNVGDSVYVELAKIPKSDGVVVWNSTAQATIKTQAAAVLTDANTELGAIPTTTGGLRAMIQFLHQYFRGVRTETSNTESVKKEDGSTELGSRTLADAAGTFTRGEMS